jgi:hypothetical protein
MNFRDVDHGRRGALSVVAAAVAAAALPLRAESRIPVEVWKDPECGCCKDWVAHMQANGFDMKVHDSGNDAVRARMAVDAKFASCHTAVVGGYAVEGHVPASEVRRLLREKPAARGLAVPGMRVGTPGMDGPAYRGRREAYDVLLLDADGRGAKVYRHYEGNA